MEQEPGPANGSRDRRGAAAGLDARDRRLLFVTGAVVALLVAGMYLFVARSLPSGTTFSGFLLNTTDGWGYAAYANAYRNDGLLADNPWSERALPGAYFNLVWFAAGKLMALGLPFRAVYHLFQAVFGALLLWSLLALVRRLAPDRATAWCAFLLSVFGAGFGWAVRLVSPGFLDATFRPIDLFQVDAFPAMGWWGFPHITLSWALVAAIYLCTLRAAAGDGLRWSLAAGGVALLTGFVHPYHFVTVLPVLAAWGLVFARRGGGERRHLWRHGAIVAAGMAPGLCYFGLVVPRAANFAHVWSREGLVRFDAPEGVLPVLVGYGAILVLAAAGLAHARPWRGAAAPGIVLVALWAAVQFPLRFATPLIPFAARLGEGLLIPLSVLAAVGLLSLRERVRQRRPGTGAAPAGPDGPVPWAWIVPLVLLSAPSVVFLAGHQLGELRQGQGSHVFALDLKPTLTAREREALAYLGGAARGSPLVLSATESGLVLPAFAPVRALLGHVTNVKDRPSKEQAAAAFFGPAGNDWLRQAVLSRYRVDYVWWGGDEDRYGGTRPGELPYLRPVFDNGAVRIYRVQR